VKALLLYRPNSEHERQALDYLRDFKMQTGKDLQTMDVDSPSGSQFIQTYDIVQFPAIIVTDDDGAVQNLWLGDSLPLANELSYYVQQ